MDGTWSQKDASALSNLPSLTDADGLAYTFYNTAKYDTQTFTRPDGKTEIEKIYYDSQGNTLGRSIQDTYEVMDAGVLRIETNIDYRGPVDEFLGRSFSDDKGNSGQNIEYRTTLTKEPTFVDFDGNGTPGETISGSGRAVRVQEDTETFDGVTTSSTKYFDANTGALLGGANVADGYVSVIGSDGYPTGELYDPQGNKQTMSGILNLDSGHMTKTL